LFLFKKTDFLKVLIQLSWPDIGRITFTNPSLFFPKDFGKNGGKLVPREDCAVLFSTIKQSLCQVSRIQY
jgi:hypothetical protein